MDVLVMTKRMRTMELCGMQIVKTTMHCTLAFFCADFKDLIENTAMYMETLDRNFCSSPALKVERCMWSSLQ